MRSFWWIDPTDEAGNKTVAKHHWLGKVIVWGFMIASIPSTLIALALRYADELAPAGHEDAFRIVCIVALGGVMVGTAAGVLWLDDLSGQKAKQQKQTGAGRNDGSPPGA